MGGFMEKGSTQEEKCPHCREELIQGLFLVPQVINYIGGYYMICPFCNNFIFAEADPFKDGVVKLKKLDKEKKERLLELLEKKGEEAGEFSLLESRI